MTDLTPDPTGPEDDWETDAFPARLVRELDAELCRHGIVLPSIGPEFTVYGGPQVHLGVTSVEGAQQLLKLLRAR